MTESVITSAGSIGDRDGANVGSDIVAVGLGLRLGIGLGAGVMAMVDVSCGAV